MVVTWWLIGLGDEFPSTWWYIARMDHTLIGLILHGCGALSIFDLVHMFLVILGVYFGMVRCGLNFEPSS
jgi:hypothetical protein